MADQVDVAVIGAGLAGLTTARELERAGRSVALLEAYDRVGGRTLNHTLENGVVVEIGGQWIGPTQDRLAALAAELEIGTYQSHDAGEHILHRDGELNRYRGGSYGMPWHVAAEVGILQKRIDSMARKVPLEAPWKADNAAKLDADSVASWARRNLISSDSRDFLRVAVQAVFSAEPEDMSMLHFLFYIHSGGGFEMLLETIDGAQDSRFRGGSQLVSIRLAEKLGPDTLRTGCPVRYVSRDGEALLVGGQWGEVRASRCVVTAPPAVISRISFDPPLSGRRAHLHSKMTAGYVIKTMARYERPFWREAGLSGQAASADHPAAVVFDNSPEDGSCGVLLAFLEGGHGRRAAALSPEERQALVIDGFRTYFGPQASEPLEYVEQDWAEEEWIRGGYGSHFGTGVWTQYGSILREPEGPIHWAGTETSPVWNGYMDGAIRSGERVAREVDAAL